MQTGKFFIPFLITYLIIAIGSAINPARDLGPRIMSAMVGYGRQGTGILGYFNRRL